MSDFHKFRKFRDIWELVGWQTKAWEMILCTSRGCSVGRPTLLRTQVDSAFWVYRYINGKMNSSYKARFKNGHIGQLWKSYMLEPKTTFWEVLRIVTPICPHPPPLFNTWIWPLGICFNPVKSGKIISKNCEERTGFSGKKESLRKRGPQGPKGHLPINIPQRRAEIQWCHPHAQQLWSAFSLVRDPLWENTETHSNKGNL